MTELLDRSAAVVKRYGGTRRQVHRRRDHGGVRCADCVGGPRFSSLHGGAGDPGRDSEAGCRSRQPRLHRAAAADRAELRPGDRRRNRNRCSQLHRHRRAGGHGAADGGGGAAGWRDAERVDGATGRERCARWQIPKRRSSKAPMLPCRREGCWRSASIRPADAATRRSSAAHGSSTPSPRCSTRRSAAQDAS